MHTQRLSIPWQLPPLPPVGLLRPPPQPSPPNSSVSTTTPSHVPRSVCDSRPGPLLQVTCVVTVDRWFIQTPWPRRPSWPLGLRLVVDDRLSRITSCWMHHCHPATEEKKRPSSVPLRCLPAGMESPHPTHSQPECAQTHTATDQPKEVMADAHMAFRKAYEQRPVNGPKAQALVLVSLLWASRLGVPSWSMAPRVPVVCMVAMRATRSTCWDS